MVKSGQKGAKNHENVIFQREMVSYERLFLLMDKYEMKPCQLSEKAGISQNIMTRIKRGQYISLESVEAICRALDCCIEDVLEFTEPDAAHQNLSNGVGCKKGLSDENAISEGPFEEIINGCRIHLERGDCLKLMKNVADESIDMILCDLPFGTTANDWDKRIPMEPLWEQYRRIIKPAGCIALFAQPPFDKLLGASSIDLLKYEWVLETTQATGFLNSRIAPLKCHTNILIFSKGTASHHGKANMIYNPQMEKGEPYKVSRKTDSAAHDTYKLKERTDSWNPGVRYPRDVLRFSRDNSDRWHPCQKPVAVCEYLIKTYTDQGALVLDNAMGSGTTGVACVRSGRNFLGMEVEQKYYARAIERIQMEG